MSRKRNFLDSYFKEFDSSESQFRFVLPRILQNATFQQKPFEIDNGWTEIQNLMFIYI